MAASGLSIGSLSSLKESVIKPSMFQYVLETRLATANLILVAENFRNNSLANVSQPFSAFIMYA